MGTPMTTQQWVEHFGVAFCGISGTLSARGKNIDLFGVTVLGLITALGGGTLRDIILTQQPFWVAHSEFIYTGIISSALTFSFSVNATSRMPSWMVLIS